ncbi:MAG: M20/M25/M40 family metallo-hydrolase [Chloroflexaceae bacterium]|nr:M20/M25/M40 family metallo-hydrolase [Chloroflexaceae bacterium]
MEQFTSYIATHQARFMDELFQLLRVPSVAAQGRAIPEAAALVRQRLERLGAAVRVFDIENGSPVIYATLGSGPRRLLIYDHYDVQPADPEELWVTPAFEPTIRDGKLYARGVADNKGNLMLRIQAIETWLATQGTLPFEVAFIIEGEEEIGSPHLPAFCRDHADLLRGDGMIWETGERNIDDRPRIDCGAKGMQYVELVVRGAAYDLHSSFATVVPNPAWRLVWALATLKGPDERILIPGFYDAIRPPGETDLRALESIPDTDAAILADYQIPAFLGGVRGVERLRRHLFEPTCNICGVVSGYTGAGSKTVLPSEARVKIDFRLVPDMRPETVMQQLRAHLDAQGFSDIAIIDLGGVYPARSDLNSSLVRAMVNAAETVYGVHPVVTPTMAGTGPMYDLAEATGTPTASGAGCGYHGMQIHAPNEHIRVDDYWLAMRWMGVFLRAFAA